MCDLNRGPKLYMAKTELLISSLNLLFLQSSPFKQIIMSSGQVWETFQAPVFWAQDLTYQRGPLTLCEMQLLIIQRIIHNKPAVSPL